MSCIESNDKKYKTRPSPPIPANTCAEGIIKKGNDGNDYITKKSANGVNRWVKYNPLQKSHDKKSAIPKKQALVSLNQDKLTIPKLKQLLDKNGVKYKKSAKKSELLALLKKL